MGKRKALVINVPTSRTKVVAIRSFSDTSVVAHGRKSSTVCRKAVHGGAKGTRPIVLHVPQKDKTYIY